MDNLSNAYTFENHPIIQTVKLKPPEPATQKDALWDVLVYSYKNIPTENDLATMYKRLRDNEKLKDIVSSLNVDFIFNPLCINRLIQTKDTSNIAMFYILHSAIAFIISIDSSFDSEGFYEILTALTFISNPPFCKIAPLMFSYILYSSVKYINQINVEQMMDILVQMTSKCTKPPQQLISALLFMVFSISYTGKIDHNTQTILSFISEVILTSPDSINEMHASAIFERCFDDFRTLNLASITFVHKIANKLPWKLIEIFFTDIAFFFASYIHQHNEKFLEKLKPVCSRKLSYQEPDPDHTTYHIGSHDDSSILIKPKDSFSVESIHPREPVTTNNSNYKAKYDNIAIFRNSQIKLIQIPDAYKLKVTENSMMIQAFSNTSPFLPKYSKFTPVYPFTQLFTLPQAFLDVERRIAYIIRIAQMYPDAEKCIFDSFMTLLQHKFDLDIAFAFLIMISKFKETYDCNELYQLLKERVFDPRITIYDAKKDFIPLLQLRMLAYKIILNSNKFDIYQFMGDYTLYPKIVSEIIAVIKELYLQKSIQEIVIFDMATTLCKFVPIYINAFRGSENQMTAPVLQIFVELILLFLKDDNYNKYFIHNELFMSLLMSLLFDDLIGPTILKQIINLLSNDDSEPCLKNFAAISSGIMKCFPSSMPEKALKLISILLMGISDIIDARAGVFDYFTSIIEDLKSILNYSIENNFSIDCLIGIVNFLTSVSNNFWLNNSERKLLSDCIIRVHGEKDDNLFNAMTSLIIGKRNITDTNRYIEHPRYLSPYYLVYKERAVDKLYEMIKFAYINSMQCHLGQIDLCLLQNWETIQEIPQKEMELFIEIAKMSSSMKVVSKLISFMCAQEDGSRSKFIAKIVDCLEHLFVSKLDNPVCSLPLFNQENAIIIKPLKTINADLSFLMWVMYDNGSEKSNLLKASIGSKSLQMILEKNELFVTYDEIKISYLLSGMVPNKWTLLAFTFGQSGIELACNKKSYKFPFPFNIQKASEIYLGFAGEPVKHPSRLGPFSVTYDMSPMDLENIKKIGPHSYLFPNTLISMATECQEHVICLERNQHKKEIYVKLLNTGIPAVFGFSDILIRFFTVQALIPIFAQILLKSQENENILVNVISLFRILFTVSRRTEKFFVDEKCWQIISYLLSNYVELLTEVTFNSFYDIFLHSSHIEFKESLLRNILINPELWIKASTDVCVRVTYHWFNTILPLGEEFHLHFSHYYADFISTLWKTSLDQIEAIHLIRTHAMQALITIGNAKFTEMDFKIVFDNIMASDNEKVITDSLEILQGLALSSSKPFKGVTGLFKYFPKIVELTANGNENVALAIVKTFSCFVDAGIFTPKFLNIIIEIFCLSVGSQYHTPHFLTSLCKLSETRPELLQLCFATITYNPLLIPSLIKSGIHPDPIYAVTKAWSFWPIVCACANPEELTLRFIINFVLSCTPKDWTTAFLITLMIAPSNLPVRSFIFEALTKAIQCIHTFTEAQITDLLNFAIFYIFYKTDENRKDVFSMKYNILPEKPKRAEEKVKAILDKINTSLQPSKLVYGLDIGLDENGNVTWRDSNIAELIIEILNNVSIKLFDDVGAILCTFLIHSKKEATLKSIVKYAEIHQPSFGPQNLLNSALHKGENMHFDKSLTEAIPDFLRSFVTKRDYFIVETTILAKFIGKYRAHVQTKLAKYRQSDSFEYNLEKRTMWHWNSIDVLIEKIRMERKNAQIGWRTLWSMQTRSCAPWHNSIHNNDVVAYKLDTTITAHYCPMKLKLNKKFDDHKEASYARDSGSQVKAQEMVRKYLEENRPVETLPQLLSVSELNSSEISNYENDDQGELFSDDAEQIKLLSTKNVRFSIKPKFITITNKDTKDTVFINAGSVTMALLRMFTMHPTGLEIFTDLGASYLIHLLNEDAIKALKAMARSRYYSKAKIQTVKFTEFIQKFDETKKWINREISNFEYLMFLNIISGRTFNDSSMYPVFPWVVIDYDCEDVKDAQLRDMSKPIGWYGENRRKEINMRMKDMGSFGEKEFMFSSCYSTPLSVFLYNLRMEPFTTLHIRMQSGKFDHSARLFNSVNDAFRMVTSHVNDYRELIPEFFYNTAIFENRNNFDLGQVGGRDCSNVKLPAWSHGSPLEFVYEHRKALERANDIEKWIDLIWGVDSRGQNAYNKYNLFDPHMYAEVWNSPENRKDPMKSMIEATMTNCGQIPPQLFSSEHPSRKDVTITETKNRLIETNISSMIGCQIDYESNNVFIISGTGQIYTIPINGETPYQKGEIDPEIVTRRKGRITAKIGNNLLICTNTSFVLAFDIVKGEVKKYSSHYGTVSCIGADKNLFASGGVDTSIRVMTSNFEPFFTFVTHSDEVTAIATSSIFKIIVATTHDGRVFIIDQRKQEVYKEITIENAFPRKVVISPGWGFIIVNYTKNDNAVENSYIAVYTVNGELVRNFKVPSAITSMFAFENSQGFDYVVAGFEKGYVYAFEAFYGAADKLIRICDTQENIIAVSHSQTRHEFCIVSLSGKIYFYGDVMLSKL